jgi:hypothetical protein
MKPKSEFEIFSTFFYPLCPNLTMTHDILFLKTRGGNHETNPIVFKNRQTCT